MNPKSDVEAKNAFKRELEFRGFSDVKIVKSPADIQAKYKGEEYLFEIKYTAKSNQYFGAATITEWEAALRSPSRFRFVIARNTDKGWNFKEFTPEEFLQYSNIPPFKIFFHVPLIDDFISVKARKRKAVAATLENLRHLIDFRQRLKDIHDRQDPL